ncbi:hypothetical protein [Klebsiella sp. RHBSTW-00215]|uniref:hypothetical protein n=1 Tax=Klebsiella sp. RHBSTW-00215 TaxID=2742640 RepID=UPI001E496204|nr:hypothetical protein [Klebsiella sp. RHBSTW-00215]
MSEFSRETLLNIIETDHVQCGEASALARMALAAMDCEPVAYTDEAELCFVNDMACMWTKGMGINEVPLYRHAQPAPVVPEDVQRDAKRWRALLGSARIRIIGSAGFDATAHPGENPDYRHFGMEIWTHYPNWLHEKNEYGIDTLTQYADAMLSGGKS